MFRTILSISALLFAGSASFAQTTVVVYRTDDAIYAAADSKTAYPFGGNGPTRACKFFKVGNVFFGVSGLNFDEYRQMVAKAGVTPAKIRRGMSDFEDLFIPWFQNVLESSRSNTPKEYEAYMHSDRPEVDFTFFGMKKKTPVVATVVFKATQDSHGLARVSVTTRIFLDQIHCPNNDSICGVDSGYWHEIAEYRARTPDWWKSKDLAAEMKSFVQIEIDARPKYVGPPIRVLTIDSMGLHWIENRKGCNSF